MVQKIFQLLELDRKDIFIDIGHGIGNATLQAAYTRGCESRGIEIMEGRYNVSEIFKKRLEDQRQTLHVERDHDVSLQSYHTSST